MEQEAASAAPFADDDTYGRITDDNIVKEVRENARHFVQTNPVAAVLMHRMMQVVAMQQGQQAPVNRAIDKLKLAEEQEELVQIGALAVGVYADRFKRYQFTSEELVYFTLHTLVYNESEQRAVRRAVARHIERAQQQSQKGK